MNRTCSATKRDGEPCTLPSKGSSGLCWAHDPSNAERRRRGQSRGGKSKPSKEVAEIKNRLRDLADGVLLGTIDKADAAVVGQIWNTFLRAVSVDLKIKEVLELETRLETLEAQLEEKDQVSAWR